MKGLLDTHAFIWWDSDPQRLSAPARAFLQDPSNLVLLSVVSVWELLIKQQLGKLQLHAALKQLLTEQIANGMGILPVSLEHVLAVESLPAVHKVAFDRLLVAQAQVEGATLLSSDRIFQEYPVPVLW